MSLIKVTKPTEDEKSALGISSWPIWEKEKSRFDWHYDQMETCFILEGEAVVETKSGEKTTFGKGDLVVFPKGLDCIWEIKKDIKKHYNFG